MSTNRTLSGLPAADGITSDDLVLVTQAGLSKKATVGDIIDGVLTGVTFQQEATEAEALVGETSDTVMTARRVKDVTDAVLVAKAETSTTIDGGGLVTGGGDLTESRTLTVTAATEAEGIAGTATDVAMTPLSTKAAIDNVVTPMQADIATLQSGQASATVLAESWTVIAAYDTTDRVDGDAGKVVGDDTGTHTDPVVGGTVDNKGVYRWSASPAGWQRIADLDADDAATSAAAAELAAANAATSVASIRMPRNFPTSGLQAFWAFDDGVGDTVTNVFNPGTLDIDLTLPTDPNFEWTGYGGKTTAGLVQSPTITGSRTVMLVYRGVRGSGVGLTLAGGFNVGAGIQGSFLQQIYDFWIGNGWGVHTPVRRSDGVAAYEADRGGWIVVWMEYDQAYNSAVGIGGEINGTTSRTVETHFACAGVWNTTLTDDQRAQAYESLRPFLVKKGIVLNWQDGKDYYDGIVLAGESNPNGAGNISDLPVADQTANYIGTRIKAGNGTVSWASPQPFALMVNQRYPDPTIWCGYEVGLATSKLADLVRSRRDMVIIKSAVGGSRLTPSSIVFGGSWNVAEDPAGGLFYQMLRSIYDAEQWARLQGVGLNIVGIQFGIGVNDAVNEAYAASSAIYQGYLQDFYDSFLAYSGLATTKIHIPRVHPHDTAADPIALANVREGQASFVDSLGALAQLMDTDTVPIKTDNQHYTGLGVKQIGAAAYTFFFP